MPWTAPEVTRPAVPRVADERTMLEAWLDLHRQTLLMKCTGSRCRAAQAAQRHPLHADLARPGPAYGGGGARLVPDLLRWAGHQHPIAPRRGPPPTSTTWSPRTRPPTLRRSRRRSGWRGR